MKMLALLPLALLSTTAMAQDYPAPPPHYDGQARGSVDPGAARAVAGAVQAVTDAILDVRIDGVRRAVDPYARNDGGQTIGDLMARRDPAYRQHLHEDMTRAARTAAGAARGAGAVKAAADEFARRIEGVLNGVEGY
jgi:hypothetical protein